MVAFVGCLIAGSAPAEVELTPLVGLQAGGSIGTRQGDLEIDPSAALGLLVSWRVRSDGMVELLYTRQDTEMDLDASRLFDLTVEQFHFGGLWEIRDYTQTRPFLGMTLGVTRMNPDLGGAGSETYFSGAISGGVKRFFNEKVGLRVEGRGLMTFSVDEGGIFCGSSFGQSGCALTALGDAFFQFQGFVGLILRL